MNYESSIYLLIYKFKGFSWLLCVISLSERKKRSRIILKRELDINTLEAFLQHHIGRLFHRGHLGFIYDMAGAKRRGTSGMVSDGPGGVTCFLVPG
jgi:hypothetical protein